MLTIYIRVGTYGTIFIYGFEKWLLQNNNYNSILRSAMWYGLWRILVIEEYWKVSEEDWKHTHVQTAAVKIQFSLTIIIYFIYQINDGLHEVVGGHFTDISFTYLNCSLEFVDSPTLLQPRDSAVFNDIGLQYLEREATAWLLTSVDGNATSQMKT